MTVSLLNTKIGELENKIFDVSSLVKKTDSNNKMSDIEKKYFNADDYSKFTKEILGSKIKEKELVDKFSISNLVKSSDLDENTATLAKKAKLKAKKYKIVKL